MYSWNTKKRGKNNTAEITLAEITAKNFPN